MGSLFAVNANLSNVASAPAASNGTILWPAFFLVVGLLSVTLPQTNFLSAIPGDIGDARFNNLILEHVYRWIIGKDAKLWSPEFFYPFPGSLAFSDNHFGTVLIYALFRTVGLATDYAFIAWYVVSVPLNFLCCHYALRRFGLTAAGASCGAFVFAFALTANVQCEHEQLAYRFAIPLAMLAWRQWVEGDDARDLSVTFLWMTVEFYCSIYLGYFLLLLLGASCVALYLRALVDGTTRLPHKVALEMLKNRREHHVFSASLIVTGCLLALAILLLPYQHYSKLYGFGRTSEEIATMLPRVWSYFMMDYSRLWGPVSMKLPDIPMRNEQQMFFGIAAIVLAAIGCFQRKNAWVRNALISLILLVAITLSVHGHSLYSIVEHFPLAKAVRAVSRIGMVMLFPLGVLAGQGYDWLTGLNRRKSDVVKIAACALLTLLIIVEYAALNMGRVTVSDWRAHLSGLKAQLPASLPKDAILFYPLRSDAPLFLTELDGMSLSQATDRSTLNGYSGNGPDNFYNPGSNPCEQAAERILAYADFAKRHGLPSDNVLNRVVVLGQRGSCQFPGMLPVRSHFSGPLCSDLIHQTMLQVQDVATSNGKLTAMLSLEENGDLSLPAISDSGQPVRLSWRVIDTSAPTPAPDDGWEPRRDVPFDVPAHGRTLLDITVDVPHKAGQYKLQVSIVQEGVAWFHDKGMSIATSEQVVNVDQAGQVTISR
jgi:hypothetical protein